MSLPVPSTAGTAGPAGSMGLDPKQLQAIDAPLIALTQQCNGDLRQLLFAFFSFLHRRTDFYLVPHPDDVEAGKPASMGFNQGDAEKLLIAAFRQFPLRRIPKGGTPAKKAAAPPTKTESKPAVPDKPAPPPKETKQPDKPKEETKTEKETPKATEAPPSASTAKNMQDVQYSEKGLQIPVGNGGSAKTYKWTQTLEECTVLVGVPKDLRGKDLSVTITTSTLSVKSKKPIALSTAESPQTMTTFLEGNLVQKVRADESTWSVEGGVVSIILDKRQKTFWDSVLEGDEKIDTELVDNRRRIGDYDDATQAQFRKIIFDQEQYHKGGPTSDEILGQKSSIPPLPTGVEYIDKKTLDDHDKKAASSK
eukprot:Nitzschia sp. Nitz4//scaffold128_size63911//2710//3804//NITZ4_006210-RA/size63911-processed-gene-0.125-mRNA-1//-1//CDS//3329534805//1331//frame0